MCKGQRERGGKQTRKVTLVYSVRLKKMRIMVSLNKIIDLFRINVLETFSIIMCTDRLAMIIGWFSVTWLFKAKDNKENTSLRCPWIRVASLLSIVAISILFNRVQREILFVSKEIYRQSCWKWEQTFDGKHLRRLDHSSSRSVL